jgi:hypothetical protein
MLASGSLEPAKKSFLRKSSPDPGLPDNSSTITSGHKNQKIKDSRRSDLFDRIMMVKQLELIEETNQRVQTVINQSSTIIATLAEIRNEIYRPKGSRNNNLAGDFA